MAPPMELGLRLLLLLLGAVASAHAQAEVVPGFAKRVVLLGIDGIAPTLEPAPTLQRLMAEGAGTLNARANLPSVSVPNWASVLTGAGPSELAISTNSWTRETARAAPVGFDLIRSCPADASADAWDPHGCRATPRDDEPWYPNILEMAKAAGVDVALFHDWAPLDRIFSSTFVASDDVQTSFCADAAVRDQYETALDCWDGTDAAALAGGLAAIRDGATGSQSQLVVVHQALVDEVGHASGWGSQPQLDSMAVLDARAAAIVEAIEEVDPTWEETLLLVTAYHGGDGTGHDPYQDQALYESRIPELLRVPWIAYGVGVKAGTRLDDPTPGGRAGRYVNIMDTAPTVMHALGIPSPPDWHCRGTAVLEAFVATDNSGVGWGWIVLVFLCATAVGVCCGLRAGRKYQPLPMSS